MPNTYTVTDVNERRRFTAGGGQQVLYDVHILTGRGATGSIRIPAADYEKDRVKKLLDALAEKLDLAFTL